MNAKLSTTLLILIFCFSFGKAQEKIPKPEKSLGFKVGADFKLADYDQSIAYFKELAEVSELMELHKAGKTSFGKSWYYSVISSKKNLENLPRIREIAQRLAHPVGLSDEEARALAKEGLPIVHIDGGLHASEVAGAQHCISLAYHLLSKADEPEIQEILDNTVILLWPSLNPDGQNIVVDWYRENLGTPYETSRMPKLYQKYIGHDNNRDAYMLNMIESRVVGRTWRAWEPNIIYVHHQSSPFPTRIWLPPFAEPVATQTPPLMAREVNMIGMAIAQALETEGKEGAVHMGTGFDAWYPGYIDYMPMLQNIPAFWTETAGRSYATPKFYTIHDFPKSREGLRNESLYSSPWKGGWWRLADAVGYMQTASLATLDYAAKYKEVILYNRYQAGRNTIRKYENEPPYAYFIPQDQRDPMRPVELLRRLAFNGVRVHQLQKGVDFEGVNYPEGTWVIPMNQEYGELVRQLLDVQEYPDLREYPEGPPEQPYDAAGWTLPLQMEVDVVEASIPLTEEVKSSLKLLKGEPQDWKTFTGEANTADNVPGIGFDTEALAVDILAPKGRLSGSGNILEIDPKELNAFRLLNKALKEGASVRSRNGKYLISGLSRSLGAKWVEELRVNGKMIAASNGQKVHSKVALYRPHTASMDEGWTRWLLEQYEFSFSNISPSDVHAGGLEKRFEVIIMASDRPTTIKYGFKEGSVPPIYAGGLEGQGIAQLDAFVKAGGTLICMNQSSNFAIEELHLPVKNVVKGVSRKDYFTGLSILEAEINTEHPVMAGMAPQANLFVSRSPVFSKNEGFKGQVLASYAEAGSPLRSGYLLGEKHLAGHAAALDVYHGKGHVILLGFQPQWRGQSMGTFRVLFNAALFGGDVSKAQKRLDEFKKEVEMKK